MRNCCRRLTSNMCGGEIHKTGEEEERRWRGELDEEALGKHDGYIISSSCFRCPVSDSCAWKYSSWEDEEEEARREYKSLSNGRKSDERVSLKAQSSAEGSRPEKQKQTKSFLNKGQDKTNVRC